MGSHRWLKLESVAKRNHGLATTSQIHSLGFSVQELRTLVERGYVKRHERGIYLVAGHPVGWQTKILRHCLATGGRAFATTAAMVHRLGKPSDLSPGYAELVVPSGARPRPRKGLRIHSGSGWNNVASIHVDQIPVLPLAETLVSIGAHHRFEVFRAAVNEARRQRRITLQQIGSAATPFLDSGRRHSHRLRTALDGLSEVTTLSLSDWSDQFADWCVMQGLPRPELEFRILDANGELIAQVDLCWPEFGLVVELDSWAWHHDRESFESDRARYSHLAAAGWSVVAITWNRWTNDPAGIAADLHAAFARGSNVS